MIREIQNPERVAVSLLRGMAAMVLNNGHLTEEQQIDVQNTVLVIESLILVADQESQPPLKEVQAVS